VGKRRNTVTFHVFDNRHAPFAHAVICQYPQFNIIAAPICRINAIFAISVKQYLYSFQPDFANSFISVTIRQ
jgi:hypothetical protein